MKASKLKLMRKYSYLLVFFLLTCLIGEAQNIAINADGANPDPSAMLDVKSINRGLLTPRVALTATDVAAPVTSPATSLLVYNTAMAGTGSTAVSPGYYFWDGAGWVRFVTGSNIASSAWVLGGNSGTDPANQFIGTADFKDLVFKINNQLAGKLSVDGVWGTGGNANTSWGLAALSGNTDGYANTAIGTSALLSNGAGVANTATGVNSLLSNIDGHDNTANGVEALASNLSGSANVAVGRSALINNQTGGNNTAIGVYTLQGNIDGSENTAIGSATLYSNTSGTKNNALGRLALSSNTTGIENVAIGNDASRNNTEGSYNTAVGVDALANSNGFANTAIGNGTLAFNATGFANTASGFNALVSNTTGNENTASGKFALLRNNEGSFNSAFGRTALQNNLTGNNNTAAGRSALFNNNSGSDNAAFGRQALLNNVSGSFNTAIGFNANVSQGDLTNATAIGANAIVDASDKVRIGDANVTVIEGQVPFTNPSDGRFKFNIKEDVGGLDFIMKLRPVTYNFDTQKQADFVQGKITGQALNNYVRPASFNEDGQIRRTGFIAQEVEAAASKTRFNFDGIKAPQNDKQYYSISYASFVVPLVKAVQQQQLLIADQQQQIEKLSKENEVLKTLQEKIEALEKAFQKISGNQ